MRVVTWNVNSLKARLGRVQRWIEAFSPDVLCLQETKLADDAFPALAFGSLGYDCFHHGEGRWNGVAVLSRVGLEDPVAGFGDGIEPDTDARLAWATCGGRAGGVVLRPQRPGAGPRPLPLQARLAQPAAGLAGRPGRSGRPALVCGDFNVAPDDRDVYDPSAFTDTTHTSEPERERLAGLIDWGLVDVFREHHADGGLFSWWDYRGGNFHKRKGMRIDLALATRPAADAASFVLIDRNERKGPKNDPPSDHAPLFVDVDLDAGSPC